MRSCLESASPRKSIRSSSRYDWQFMTCIDGVKHENLHRRFCFIVLQLCLGRPMCTIPFEKESFFENGRDPCPETVKTLSVQVRCGGLKTGIA